MSDDDAGHASAEHAGAGQAAAEDPAAAPAAARRRTRGALDVVATLSRHAPSLVPLVHGDPTLAGRVLASPLDRAEDAADFARRLVDAGQSLDEGPALHRALRRLRQEAVVRVALREVLRLADVDQTAADLAALAAAATDAALTASRRRVEATRGPIEDAAGRPIPLVALGMGKLGGRELNFGSDVDLIFFHGRDEGRVGEGEETPPEAFARIVQRTANALGQVTRDGFVFRVDLRLRPAGSAGPLSMSLARAERYYARFGRTWERAALMRATPVAGDLAFGRKLLDALGSFIWRRPVDPALGRAMHGMVIQSRRELRVDAENDVKLGVGGIRELEFFVQSLQLVWGGQHPELRVPGTMEALTRLARLGFVTAAEHDALAAAWALLRRVEHRVHMVAGYQTHVLPVGEEREDFARSLGFANAAGFDDALGRHRDTVHRLFQTLLEGTVEGAGPRGAGAAAPPAHDALLASLRRLGTGQSAGDLEAAVAAALDVHDAGEATSHLRRLARRPESPFGVVGAGRRPALAPRLLQELAHAADVDAALRHLTDFLVRSGPGHQARLLEEPRLARRLIALFGASPTLARALVGHPETLDALLLGSSAPSADHIRQEHAALGGDVPGALVAPPRVEVEGFVGALRRRKRELTLRIGLAHLGGELDDSAAQRLLTALADAQVRAAFAFARRELVRRRGAPQAGAAMVVVGMGKLGSGELGYGSDLDLTFLFRLPRGEDRALHAGTRGGTPPTHGELYTRVAQRTLSLLAQPDAEGPGFETDTRLRPSGNQGLLVVSDRAFARYHALHARGWERQALLKARVVAHDEAAFGDAMGALLRATAFRGPPEPARMAELRARMQRELAQERPERLHPKLGFGGLVDVELTVQTLQLRHGASDAQVRPRHTLDAIAALESRGHLRSDAEPLRDGYRFFRGVEQALRLLEPRGDGRLALAGPRAAQVARLLGLRDRDGHAPARVLAAAWRRRAQANRRLFERHVAPVDAGAPWETAGP